MGRLERKLDEDLIDRIDAGWTPSARIKPVKKSKPPREASSYRGARRNAERGMVWRAIHASRVKVHHAPPVHLNRSKKWDGVPLTKPYR